ncbi:DNRLRE domain-containing protein [Streptomyces sp. Ru71]|uniref:DNRLRE domain-containing protein n=1 Tax=Streptomyces sp. Ru71 TaxID=2080746 RepID=UPI0021561B0A|nr:DNRLRE domain-containing protein [Streptomyces sp. Ru71]
MSLTMLAEIALMLNTGQAVAVGKAEAGAPTSKAAKAVGPAEAQDTASAMLMARLQDRRIEVLSARTEDSNTWALPSGALQTESFAGPVRVRRAGKWQDIDTSLSDVGADLKPRAAAADVAVSDGGDSELASVARGKSRFSMGWQGRLPAPKVKGSTASYDLGAGQTLKVTAQKQGFSEEVILADSPDNPVSYRIPLRLDGLKLSQAASGHLLMKDASGRLVAEAPAPMMWDSSKDPRSGDPKHVARVATKIETAKDGSQTLVLTPDAKFLADPALTYPVTVDPTSTLAVTTDTWVQTPDYPDSQLSSGELKSGTYDAGSDIARSYLKFNVSPFTGKHIIDTNLALYSYYSSTCATTGAGTEVRRITGNWDSSTITWGTQPATTTTGAVVNKAALGYNTSCPAGTMNFDIDAIVAAWASGSANYGLRIGGASETDSLTWRRFRSANYISGDNSVEPHLTVTYNSYPAVPTSSAISPSVVNAYNGKRYVTSLTPTLSAKVTDSDGGTVKAQFEVTPDPAYADTTYTYTATSAGVASGSTASLAVPSANAFPAGAHLRYRVRGYDSTDYGSWTGYTTFVLNTALPAAPTVNCAPYPQGTWSAKAPGSVTCTLDTTSTDGQGFKWGLDDSAMSKSVYDTVDGTGGDPLNIAITPADGWHTLYAQTIDSGGNLSTATTKYSFGVGTDGAALLSPGDGDRPARRVALSATGKTTYTGVTYQYRRGETDTWHNVPLADVSKNSDGTAVTAWPLAAPNGAPPALTWNITTSLAEDGPVEIRAAFTDGTTTGNSLPVTVTVDRQAGDAPTQSVGPGEVNLLTGDFSFSESDVSAFSMSVDRSVSSRQPTAGSDAEGQVAIFGPQWTSGTTAETSDSDYAYIRKTSATSVSVVDVDGVETGFTATSTGGWKSEPGAEELTLTGSLTGSFTLKETDGTTTTFTKVDAAATTWQVSTTYLPTDNSTTKVVSEKVVSGSLTLARPKYVIAPTSAVAPATCETTPSTKGCRLLEYVYATSTTATSTAFGDYVGRVTSVRLWATDPGAASATATAMVQYAYDASGRLREAWDPRISPLLKTAYTYDSAGRIATLTPGGELPWTFTYGTAGNAATAGPGMLLKASRPTLVQGSKTQTDGGTATTSVVYDVPLTGAKAPYAMGAPDVAAWGQSDAASDATAVFPPDAVPASNDGAALTAGSYSRAAISYADASGREVNSADPGGHIITTEYDHVGNVVRELNARNRELALATGGSGLDQLTRLGINGSSTAERAQKLSTVHVYSSDATRELETFGPLHLVTLVNTLQGGAGGTSLAAGTETPARQHVVTAYDEGRPTDGSATVSNQPTTITTSARVDGFPTDADARVSTMPYDWAKGLPTSTTDDPNGVNITRTTVYDAQGRVVKTMQPKSNGSDAGTTVTTYWSATGTGACNGRPEWADLLCSVGPAGAITGGGANPAELPTKTTEYDRWGNVAKVTETANGLTRTTTLTYDAAGRAIKSSITGGLGTAVSDTTTTYDGATGTVASVTSNGQTITQSSDMLGRGISYSDGSGNTTTTEYDSLDRPVKVTDSAPSTTTFTYDTAQEPRGLPVSRTDSLAGTVSAVYDANGSLVSEKLPGGYTLTLTQDEAGAPTTRVYTRDSDGVVVASDTVSRSVHGQIVEGTDTAGTSRTRSYTYDGIDRLTRTDDTAPDGTCTRRDYTFDKNTNRTALATSTGAAGEACTSTGATTVGSTYDTADRLLAAGTVYDAFGRTTTTGSTTLTYHVNDLVQSETVGDNRTQWSLDAVGRLAQSVQQTKDAGGVWNTTTTLTNHYGSSGDSPAWSRSSAGAVVRSVPDMAGGLGASTSATGDVVLKLTNMHGDVTVQLPLDTAVAPVAQSYDEYGNRLDDTAATTYGWLGGAQRDSGTLSGITLMGVRLYDSATGRFLQIDPVQGGNDNNYEYCRGNPVGCTDVSGAYSYTYSYDLGYFWSSAKEVFSWVRHHFWVFPFTGCGSTLSYGERCNLAYGVFPVRVVELGKTYWKFKSLKGHLEGAGKTIKFSFSKSWGRVKLTVSAKGANDKWFQKHMLTRWGNMAGAWLTWLWFASNVAWYAPRW